MPVVVQQVIISRDLANDPENNKENINMKKKENIKNILKNPTQQMHKKK